MNLSALYFWRELFLRIQSCSEEAVVGHPNALCESTQNAPVTSSFSSRSIIFNVIEKLELARAKSFHARHDLDLAATARTCYPKLSQGGLTTQTASMGAYIRLSRTAKPRLES